MILLDRVTKTYPRGDGKPAINRVSLHIDPNEFVILVGTSGAGKSTLLKMMAGIDKEFNGEAWAADGVTVGYLAQEPELDPKKDVLGNVMEGVGATAKLLEDFEAVSNAMADPDADFDTLLAKQAELQEKIDHLDAWSRILAQTSTDAPKGPL